jgi:hypothetical protein
MTFDEIQRLLDAASPGELTAQLDCDLEGQVLDPPLWTLVQDGELVGDLFSEGNAKLFAASVTLLPLLLEVARAAKRAEQKLDRMVEKGNLESGVITITEDDFDAWFIRDDLHLALSKLESYKLGEGT